MRVSKRGISKRRPRRKTSFPLVAIVKKKTNHNITLLNLYPVKLASPKARLDFHAEALHRNWVPASQ